MSITISNIQTDLNSILGDSSTDRISAAERLAAITEATYWAKEELDNDHAVKTYDLNYFDGAHYYKVSTALSDLFEGNDLRRAVGENNTAFTRKDSRGMAEDIAQYSTESAFSIERRDGNAYLVINHQSKYTGMQAGTFASSTADTGTWTIDETTSDATNLLFNSIDFTEGNSSLQFDVDVSQSVNNRATIINSTLSSEDLTDDKDISSWLLDIKLPEVTYFSSVTFYWGSDSSNYWSVTQTTDMNSAAFAIGWNTLKFDWLGATMTGTPDVTEIAYFRIDFNYTGSQTDATSYRVDNLRLVRPEKLKFYYSSWDVGTNTSGTAIKTFTATTDVPYFSAQYDGYRFPVAHKAASIIFRNLRLGQRATEEEQEAYVQMNRVRKIIPKSRTPESKNFKPRGISFMRRGIRRSK